MFRTNVAALILCEKKYLGCYRSDHNIWQSVQGGIEHSDLSPREAIIREVTEELGVDKRHFKISRQSRFWRRYYFPPHVLKLNIGNTNNIGQEQMWFMIELNHLSSVCLEKSCHEFTAVDLFSIQDLLDKYISWKKSVFSDFCREMDLIK